MKRLHVHVAVDSLSDSIGFYSKMFAAEPGVVKSDYAKWTLDDPRVNFAISQRGLDAGVNHLGIQVESADELAEMEARLSTLQSPVLAQENASCCYAKSDKYWVEDPSGIAWETFHTLDSVPVYGEHTLNGQSDKAEGGACCIPLARTEGKSACCVPAKASATGACC